MLHAFGAHVFKYIGFASAMALSNFEIAVGGIGSIPTLGGLVFLSYKAWGERNLDASKLKAKQPKSPPKKKEVKQKSESEVVGDKDTNVKKSGVKELGGSAKTNKLSDESD
ncbi:hypothetical protein [Synechococcus sp. A15-127]|uniref:hypothetical protein n=1 Tax=Synechococcus sp. A15-127 TaxID=1050624 RepID=UPI001648D932|nr:hypothetical protein [Synechococcus sp. A15-127]